MTKALCSFQENCNEKIIMNDFFQENVEGETKEKSFVKQLTFGKLPECLCLHIQRTGWSIFFGC